MVVGTFASSVRPRSARVFSRLANPSSSGLRLQPATSPFSTAAYKNATFAKSPLTVVHRSTILSDPKHGTGIVLASLLSRNMSMSSTLNQAAPSPSLTSVEDNLVQAVEKANENVQQSVASTAESVTSQVETAAGNTITDVSAEIAEIANMLDPATTASLTGTLVEAAGPKAGELVSLGLTSWSPPGLVTHLLDLVGTTTGLPWYGTIIATTLTLRLILGPIIIRGQKNAIRLGNIQPQMKTMMDNIKHFKAVGDQAELARSVAQVQKLMTDHKATPWGTLVPIAVQFPIMFSFFLALERIAKSGSETFAHGGFGWVTDLSASDPYYILPAVSTMATLAVAEMGFYFGTAGGGDQNASKFAKYAFRALLPFAGWFSSTFPAGVLLYWSVTNIYSLLQLLILQIPVVRKFFSFPKKIQPPTNPYDKPPANIMESFKKLKAQFADSSSTSSSKASTSTSKSASVSRAQALNELLEPSPQESSTAKRPEKADRKTKAPRSKKRKNKA